MVDANIPGNTYLDRATGQVTQTNTGNIRIPYRDIRSGWDDWPPVFTPQYVAYQGAITNTVELPLGRTNNRATKQANSKVNIEVAGVVIETAVDYVADNAGTLLENQIEIFRRGTAGEPLSRHRRPTSTRRACPSRASGPRSGTRPTSTRPSSPAPT